VKYVISIEALHKELLTEAGQKSLHLSELLSSNFHVPKGFCILSSAYKSFVQENALESRTQSLVEDVCSPKNHTDERVESELRALWRQACYPTTVRDEILSAYRTLSGSGRTLRRVAVRSSGSQEDGLNASFAGQFESYLNVQGEAELLEQVKQCWVSSWRTHCLQYHWDRCGANTFAGIAVLVQEMIPARKAGVLFSANPISGNAQEMVIEASWGLGEAIVGGIVKPDRFVVDSESKKILKQTIQEKQVMFVLDRRRGAFTRQVPVPQQKQSAPCLTQREIQALVDAGRKIHTRFGRPQDIEWAIHKSHLYVLQARPITTLPCTKKEAPSQATMDLGVWESELDTPTDPDTEWTSTTIREMLPGALSPLTISQMNALEYGFQKTNQELGLLPKRDPTQDTHFLGFFYNRAHLNMSLIRGLIRQVPLVSSENLERILQEEAVRLGSHGGLPGISPICCALGSMHWTLRDGSNPQRRQCLRADCDNMRKSSKPG
jgi:hypothetical protein